MSRKPLFVLATLLLAALACNLQGGSDSEGPTLVPIATQTPTPFTATPPVLVVTATPLPTGTPAPTDIPVTIIGCTPNTAWPTYEVQAGDTLGNIADLTSTTADVLAQANCLPNPELIFVGQELHVPFTPPTVTPPPTSTPPPQDNILPIFTTDLTVERHWRDEQGYAVTYLDTVRVNAGEVVNALRVRFYVNDPSAGAAVYIGEDTDPWDGAFVDYAFPLAGTFTFQAVAENEQATRNSTIFTVRYDPGYSPPGGQNNLLSIAPLMGYDSGLYTLQAGTTVSIAWPNGPTNATSVTFTLVATDGGVSQSIGTDTNPADGIIISWFVPVDLRGQVQGVAAMTDGSTTTSATAQVASQ